MKKLSLLLFGWWLGSSYAFDFGDGNNAASPAFNFKLTTHLDSGFEHQKELETQLDIFEQTPANASLFIPQLLGDIDLWDDDKGNGLLERQMRTCPPGTC